MEADIARIAASLEAIRWAILVCASSLIVLAITGKR